MKNTFFKKITAVVMALVLCASVAVVGITAASAQTATPNSAEFKTDDLSRPALKDGVWTAVTAEGDHLEYTFNSAEGIMTLTNVDKGVSAQAECEFISAIGMYQLSTGHGDKAFILVLDNDGTHATIRFEDYTTMDLTYEQSTTDLSMPALSDGVWEVRGTDDGCDRVVINSAENSIIKMSSASGTGVPCTYDFISAIGNYQLTVGCPDFTEIWHITANNGSCAAITTDAGQNLTLVYICGLDEFDF